MMRNVYLFLPLFLLSATLIAQQPIITLIEESNATKFSDTLPTSGPAIVDINSTILLRLNVSEIQRLMLEAQGVDNISMNRAGTTTLQKLLSHKVAILDALKKVYKENPPLEALKELAQLKISVLEPIIEDQALFQSLQEAEISRFSVLMDADYPYIAFVMDFLEEEEEALNNQYLSRLGILSNEDSARMIFFRLGAFIKNRSGGRPIHVENFDSYDREAYSEVLRFTIPISAEEKKALLENAKLANTIQNGITEGLLNFKQSLEIGFGKYYNSVDAYKQFRESYLQTLQQLQSKPEASKAALLLEEHFGRLSSVQRVFEALSNTYTAFLQGINNPNSFINPSGSIIRLDSVLSNSFEAYENRLKEFERATSDLTTGREDLREVSREYKNFVNEAQQDLQELASLVNQVQAFLEPFRKSYLSSEKFSNAVKRFTAGNIPEEGYIELKYTGERKEGDEILIKALIERGNKAEDERKELFRRYISLQRISSHIKMSGTLILANPYLRNNNSKVTLTNTFQFSPTYGVFIKWGSRKSKFYNEFINLGLGLSFSSPDFNLDGTPEFGSGLIMTAFKDLISAGWGWNFGVDTPYTFLGFNIPFSIGGTANISTTAGLKDDF